MCERVVMYKLILILFILSMSAWSSRIKEVLNLKFIYFSPISEKFQNNSKSESINAMPIALERWQDKLFLVTPRFKLDVPITLSYINITSKIINSIITKSNFCKVCKIFTLVYIFYLDMKSFKNSTPILNPYPNEKLHDISEHHFTSVIKVRADVCDRLWILDNGKINNKRENAPVLYVYDLKTDLLLRTLNLEHLTNVNSDFSNMDVDVTSSTCEDAYVYIPDSENYRLLVYSWKTNESHVLTHNYFHFDPLCGDINLGDVHYQSQKGIYGIALSPVARDGYRSVYFHSIASTIGFAVNTKTLRNKTYNRNTNVYDFKVMGTRGNQKQATSSSFDMETGVLFYALLLKNELGCWNSYR